MKTAILCFALAGFFSAALSAQTPEPASTPTTVTDVLHYYLNKEYFESGKSQLNTFPYHLSAAATTTEVTHVGSKFENHGILEITGIEAYAAKYGIGNTTNQINLFLCNLHPQTGLPMLPPVDSITVWVGANSVNNPVLIGGNFATTRTVTTDFALLMRNMSQVSGDSVQLLRTSALAPNNATAVATKKYGEGNGFVRYNTQFFSTRNFSVAGQGFGTGTDYEFCIAPRVKYEIQAGHITPPAIADTVCTRTNLTFTNTSTWRYNHRMYNLISFYLKWNADKSFKSLPSNGGFVPDSAITWYFEFYDNNTPPRDPRVQLPYSGTGTVVASTDRPGCFNSNALRTTLKSMNAFGGGPQWSYSEEFNMCLKFCNDASGITSTAPVKALTVYPNPSSNGLYYIDAPDESHTAVLYDDKGSLIQTFDFTGPYTLSISKKSRGLFILKITSEKGVQRVFKLLRTE